MGTFDHKEYKRQWYLANRERTLAAQCEQYQEKREAKIEYQRRYRAENADKVRASNAQYQAKKPEKKREFQARYHQRHREKILKANAIYNARYWKQHRKEILQRAAEAYAADPQKHRDRCKKWAANNREYTRANYQKYRARSQQAAGSFTVKDIRYLQMIQGNMCVACEAPFDEVQMSLDHVIPLSRGGSNWPDNLQLLCRSCNCKKSARTMVEWLT